MIRAAAVMPRPQSQSNRTTLKSRAREHVYRINALHPVAHSGRAMTGAALLTLLPLVFLAREERTGPRSEFHSDPKDTQYCHGETNTGRRLPYGAD